MAIHRPAVTRTLLGSFALACMAAQPALAQHSDIEVEGIENGQIVLHTDEAPAQTPEGLAIFEAEFGENSLLPHQTDDPGFATEEGNGPFDAGTLVNFRALGSLSYWDGLTWGAPADATRLHVLGNSPGSDVIYSGAGLSDPSTGLIDVIGDLGELHQHVEFCIEDLGIGGCPDTAEEIDDNSPLPGGYLIEMSMFGTNQAGETVYSDSDSFFVAFNNELSDEVFEAGIDQLTAVPLPPAVLLFGSALAFGALRFRRRAAA